MSQPPIRDPAAKRGGTSAARSLIVPLALVLVALLLAGVIWALAQVPAPLAEQPLPDGSLIRVEAVTAGKEHRFVSGPWWKRLLASLAADRMPVNAYHWQAGGPGEILFWASWRPAQLTPVTAELFDEHGCRFDTDQHLRNPPASGEPVTAWITRVAPRRAPWIGLRLRSLAAPGGKPPLGEFRLPNPQPGPHPLWTPEPLPAARRTGDVAFTLTGLTTGADGPGPSLRRARPGHPTWSRASFRITRNGRPADEWGVVGLTLSDATGNSLEARSSSQYSHEGQSHFAMVGGLCAEEPAWKLRAEFARLKAFDRSDLWVVRDVPITRSGALLRSHARFTRHGMTLRLLGVAAGKAEPPPGADALGSVPTVHIQAASAPKGVRLSMVQVTDDRGRRIRESGSSSSGRGLYSFGLQAPDHIQRVNLTLAVQRNQLAEFLARPSRVQP